jgi:predicted lipid-binding transport protein (Tim44 family)
MARVARLASLTALLTVLLADLALAQAGGGSSSFGGGGGGGGGGVSGGRSGRGGTEEGDPVVVIVVLGSFVLLVLSLVIWGQIQKRKVRRRAERVRAASAEAAEDDAYLAADAVEREAAELFREAQEAWDRRDRRRLAELVGEDLMVEWALRLDDFDSKGWHNRVEVVEEPKIQYVGLTNREDDSEDRAVVRIEAQLKSYVLDREGKRHMRTGAKTEDMRLWEYWTLARRDGHWTVTSIEQHAEGGHHLDEEIVASPWSDSRVADEALAELASEDKVPEGFTTADLAELDFDGDARRQALDLSLADARFAPDLLEAAARRAVAAWAEAVDGEDEPLEAVASAEAVDQLLYGGDHSRKTRLVIRGPRVKKIKIRRVDVAREPAAMDVQVDVFGRRYVEARDTAAVVRGDKNRPQLFVEQWLLTLDGSDDSPWRLADAAAAPA